MKRKIVLWSLILVLSGITACGDKSGTVSNQDEAGTVNELQQDGTGVENERQQEEPTGESTGNETDGEELISFEYEPDEINEECCFGTEQEAYRLRLNIDTFEKKNYNSFYGLEREGDWMMLGKGGDPIYEIIYRSQENIEQFLISLLEFRMKEYYTYETDSELPQDIAEYVRDMTPVTETDKYNIPTVMVGEQQCKVTCYEFPIKLSMAGGKDLLELNILYRIDMPNGDALFIRALHDLGNGLDYYFTMGMPVYAIQSGETLKDMTLKDFQDYIKEYPANDDSLIDQYESDAPLFDKLAKDLCELIEHLEITVE